MLFDIEEELKKLPSQPGVYIMHDAKDEIIYVGKAISLKNRVRQYFQSSRNKSAKILQMVERIRRFEYIVTDSEPGYREMISGLHAEDTYQLYRDYLDNFRINHGGR